MRTAVVASCYLGAGETAATPGPRGAALDRCLRHAGSPTRWTTRRDAELGRFAVAPAVSPPRILLREANHTAGDARDRRRAAGRAAVARVVRARGQPARPGHSAAGVTGKMSAQHRRGSSGASAANHTWSAGLYRTRPAWRRSTAFSCRSTSSSASFVMPVRDSSTASPSIRRTST
jgi:hypothetical protein